jgi:hypothetical protein
MLWKSVYRLAEIAFLAAAVDAVHDRKNEEYRGPEGNSGASISSDGLTSDVIHKFRLVIGQNGLMGIHLHIRSSLSQSLRCKSTENLWYGALPP